MNDRGTPSREPRGSGAGGGDAPGEASDLAERLDNAGREIGDVGVLAEHRLERLHEGLRRQLVVDGAADDRVERVRLHAADAAELLAHELGRGLAVAALTVELDARQGRGRDEGEEAVCADDGRGRGVAEDLALLLVEDLGRADGVRCVEDDAPGAADGRDADAHAREVGDRLVDAVALLGALDLGDRGLDRRIVEAERDGGGDEPDVLREDLGVDPDGSTEGLAKHDAGGDGGNDVGLLELHGADAGFVLHDL